MWFYIFCIFIGLLAFDFTDWTNYALLAFGIFFYWVNQKFANWLGDKFEDFLYK